MHCIAFEHEEALQDWPIAPELHQQDSHTFSDMTPSTEPSPRESPIPPESSQTHYAPPDHPDVPSYQSQSYGQPDPDLEHYSHPQNGHAAPVQTGPNGQIPNGQDYHTGAPPGRPQLKQRSTWVQGFWQILMFHSAPTGCQNGKDNGHVLQSQQMVLLLQEQVVGGRLQ